MGGLEAGIGERRKLREKRKIKRAEGKESGEGSEWINETMRKVVAAILAKIYARSLIHSRKGICPVAWPPTRRIDFSSSFEQRKHGHEIDAQTLRGLLTLPTITYAT